MQAIFNVIKHHGFEDVILYDQNLLELAELLEVREHFIQNPYTCLNGNYFDQHFYNH